MILIIRQALPILTSLMNWFLVDSTSHEGTHIVSTFPFIKNHPYHPLAQTLAFNFVKKSPFIIQLKFTNFKIKLNQTYDSNTKLA
jgi:hypothetical protein